MPPPASRRAWPWVRDARREALPPGQRTFFQDGPLARAASHTLRGKRLAATGLRVACSSAPAPAGRPVATPPGPPWADPIPVTPASGGTARAHHHRPSRRWMDSRVRVDEMNYYGKSIPEYLYDHMVRS